MTSFARKQHLTVLGWITFEASDDTLTNLRLGKFGSDFGSSLVIEQSIQELEEYLAGQRQDFTVKLAAKGTAFQERVWTALSKIPYGVFPSYSDIAEIIGRPTATRAVGMAIHHNPIAIMIPCHRVIGKNGTLTGYAGGLELKRALMDLELSTAACYDQRRFAPKRTSIDGLFGSLPL